MNKKIMAIAAIMAIAMSFSGCGKKEDTGSNIVDKEANTTTATLAPGTTAAPKTAEQAQEELDNFAKDADKNADMDKIAGTPIKGEGEVTKGDLGGFDVEILDAILADGENSKVLIVEYEFKNNTSTPANFASVISAEAFQNDAPLANAVTFSAEGYEVLTIAQNLEYGDKIKVQNAYVVQDPTVPVTVEVMKHENFGGSQLLSKTFNLQ